MVIYIVEMATIREWIRDQEITGHSSFSMEDVQKAFPELSNQVIQNNLVRLKQEKRIQSVYRRYYVTIPVKYVARGSVPPAFYVADLMQHLKRPYYFGLLTAARVWGASHQAALLDYVVTTYPQLNASSELNGAIRWCYRSEIPSEFLVERKDENGRVLYSSPELTAVELVQYEHQCGGLSNVATVLAELAEQLDFTKLPSSFFVRCKGIVLQRLGYILDEVLGETAVAEALHRRWLDLCKPTRGRLSARSQSPVTVRNARWHIGINAEVEVDDL